MTFFVSKSLEGVINVDDLKSEDNLEKNIKEIYEDKKEYLYPLSMQIKDTVFEIVKIENNLQTVELDLNYEEVSSYLNLLKDKNCDVKFFAFDNLLFVKKINHISIDSYERISMNIIKLTLTIKR